MEGTNAQVTHKMEDMTFMDVRRFTVLSDHLVDKATAIAATVLTPMAAAV